MRVSVCGFIQYLCLAFVALLIAGCGGGGGGGDGGGGFTNPDTIELGIIANRTELPANPAGIGPDPDLPYTTLIQVVVNDLNGGPAANGTVVQLTVADPNVGVLHNIDDLETAFASTSDDALSGVAQFLFTSADPGSTRLIATALDPVSGREIAAQIVMTVGEGVSGGRPQDLQAIVQTNVLFLRGLNGPTSTIVQVLALDAAGEPVSDPPAGVNNLRIELVSGGPNGGEVLSGFNAKGGEMEGSVLFLRTTNGIAQFNVRSGVIPGVVAFQMTADRADNNIDNGIQNPISNAAAVSIVTAVSDPDNPLSIDSDATLAPATEDVFYATILQAVGGAPPYVWSLVSGQLPPGLTLSPSGLLSGTPTAPGTYNFVLRLDDQELGTAVTQVFTLVVETTTLEITTDSLAEGAVGATYADVLAAEGGTGDLTWSIQGQLPPGLSLNPNTGAITGTPTAVGTYSFVARAQDSNGAFDEAALSITITSDLAVEIDSLPDGAVGVSYGAVFNASGGVPPYTWSVAAGALPTGLNLNSNGTISGTPFAAGTFNFVARVRDAAGNTALQQVSITIAPQDGGGGDALEVSTTDLEGGFQGVQYAEFFEATGGTPPYTWEITSGSLPPGLTLDPDTGVISGTPTTTGTFNLVVQATDASGATDLAALSITVQASQSTLSITTAATLPEATPNLGYLTVLNATGGQPPYTWSTVAGRGTLPPGLTLNADGTITGTPTTAGTFSFLAQVTDSVGVSARQLFTIIVGGGGGGGGEPVVDSVELLASSPQLNSSGGDPVELTAVVKDINNNVVEGVEVTFSADNDGTLQITQAITDESGTATALLTTPGNRINRTITVTATAQGQSDTVSVQVVGTSINITGPESAVIGATFDLTVTVRDSAGNGIPNVPLTVASQNGNPVNPANPTTGTNGQVVVTVTAATGGEDTITVTGPGDLAATRTIDISADQFFFIEPEPDTRANLFSDDPNDPNDQPVDSDNPEEDELVQIRVVWNIPGSSAVGRQVTFTTTRGRFLDDTLSTEDDSSSITVPVTEATVDQGVAEVELYASSTGPAVVTATGDGLGAPSEQIRVLFVASTAAEIDLQANPAILATNPPGSTGEQSTVVAVVRDSQNNLVVGKTVNFTIAQDITGGTISPASAVTDEFGRATTTYTAGSVPSAENGVVIQAVVVDNPDVFDTVRLTVARRELFITLGTGNELTEDPTRYFYPYSVLVTDATGGPVANAEVSLAVVPTAFYKGFYVFPEGANAWQQIVTAGACPNEDVNRNGILDEALGEDYNGNDRLDPGNVVTLSQSTVTTDADGFALFDVVYAQQFATWVDVELTARASVSGTEAVEVLEFTLEGLASDYTNEDVDPPGNPSPFGRGDPDQGNDSCLIPESSDDITITTDAALPTTTNGENYSVQLDASGGVPPLTWDIISGSLPGGLELTDDGVIEGSVNPSESGTFTFIVEATDSVGTAGRRQFRLQIVPVITTASLPPTTVDASYNQTLGATGGDGFHTWTLVSGSLPDGLTLSSGGVISGVPESSGTFAFTVQATDGTGASDSRQFSILVNPAPEITTESLPSTSVNASYNQILGVAGGDGNYSWSVLNGVLPNGLTLTNGVIAGTPTTAGTFDFTVQVTDGNGVSGTQDLSITVTSPQITTEPLLPSATQGQPYNETLEVSGGSGNYLWTLANGDLPDGLMLNADGVISGTPTTVEIANFTVQVTDSNGVSDTQGFTLQVN